MKKILLSILFLSTISFGQDCSQLFFSEYVEGWSNNKALEIYNPTGEEIDLSSTLFLDMLTEEHHQVQLNYLEQYLHTELLLLV